MRVTLLGAALATVLIVGCGDNDSASIPETLEVGDVTITTDPLLLSINTPHGFTTIAEFVEVGTVANKDETQYYDPRTLDARVSFATATRAVAFDPDTDAVTLDNGVVLMIHPHASSGVATLTLDASGVAEAVLVRLVLPLDATEPVYGTGESFVAANVRGTVREMQFRLDLDSESGLNETHVPVPVALFPARGLGLFVEDRRPGAMDLGATDATRATVTFTLPERGALAAHLFTADDPLDLTRRYATLSALPAVPPRWAFAPQQWRNVHNSSDEVRNDALAMRANDIPGSTMWIDNPWQTAYNDFTFDETRFVGIDAVLAELKALGYRVLVWSTPYVNRDGPTAADFSEARSQRYLVHDGSGAPVVLPWQNGPGSLVDFTAPGASAWWQERINRVISRGISGFKLDFGEDIVPEFGGNLSPFTLHEGDAQSLHARYSAYYHRTYLEALPDGDGFLITRAGGYGDQAVNTCIWPGDLDSDFSRHGVDNGDGQTNVGGLPAAIAGGLSLSVSGYPFYGSDIGGYREGPPTTEAMIRWIQYAALGTIMQLGGGGSHHNVWDTTLFDPPTLEVYKRFSRLHMDLVPYLYSLALQAGRDGTPVTRPARFVEPAAESDDASFFLGDHIFVAPVIEDSARTREVALPSGEWIDWWTGARTTGGGPATEVAAPLETLPLWRRANALLPLYALAADTLEPATAAGVRSYQDPAFGRELRLLLTPEGPTTSVTVYDGSSASAAAESSTYALETTAGTTFDVFVFELDTRSAGVGAAAATGATEVLQGGTPLAIAADRAELNACAAPGCWFRDPAADRIWVRLHGSGRVVMQ